jgi:transposase
MPQSRTLDVGLDVHQASIAVASVAQDYGAEVSSLGAIGTRPCDIDQLSRTLQSTRAHLMWVDEAGPCGYWRSRDLTKNGHGGWGVAPSRMPKQAGDRVTTDRREARPLARLTRSGDLTAVDVPPIEDDAMRALSRARADAIRDRQAAKSRLNAGLRRHNSRETGRATGGPAHRRWLAEGVCPTPAQPIVFQEDGRAVTEPTARLPRLEQALQAQANTWRRAPVVEALQALRGVQVTVAVTTVAALGDLTRFDHPTPLMSALGLTPADDSSGERRRQGSLTKTGNRPARRALIAGAWASRDPANVGRHRP